MTTRIRFTYDMDRISVESLANTEEVALFIDGPRAPFQLVNETNGMTMRFTGELAEGEQVWMECFTHVCCRVALRVPDAPQIPAYAELHVPPMQQGWGWMRLSAGENQLRIVPL